VPEVIMLLLAQMAKNLPQALVQTHGGIKMAELPCLIYMQAGNTARLFCIISWVLPVIRMLLSNGH
jgi:hypothetical protein